MTHVALKLLPSVVRAVMVALPVDFAVTKPVEDTIATLVLLEVHVTDGLVVVLGNTVALSCNVLPVYRVAEVWLSEIEVASCLTVTEQEALKSLPSAVLAVIVAFPADTAVTNPDEDTVTTLVLLELHVTDGLDVVLGNTVALNCNVFPVYRVADV